MSSNLNKRPALGKGLSALLENAATDITSKTNFEGSVGSVSNISIGECLILFFYLLQPLNF